MYMYIYIYTYLYINLYIYIYVYVYAFAAVTVRLLAFREHLSLRTATSNPRPKHGLGCLVSAMFSRQRTDAIPAVFDFVPRVASFWGGAYTNGWSAKGR